MEIVEIRPQLTESSRGTAQHPTAKMCDVITGDFHNFIPGALWGNIFCLYFGFLITAHFTNTEDQQMSTKPSGIPFSVDFVFNTVSTFEIQYKTSKL